MAEFEQKYIYSLIKDKLILFLRNIGDVLMLLTKSEKQLKDLSSKTSLKAGE